MQRAGAKYQHQGAGARKHAARQAKFSAKKRTHHSFPLGAPGIMLPPSSAPVLAPADAEDCDGTVALTAGTLRLAAGTLRLAAGTLRLAAGHLPRK
jgi:hypothetical protein